MNHLKNRAKWGELGAALALATSVAIGLWAVGLSEVLWAPYFAVAIASGRRRAVCFDRPGDARS